MITRLKKFLLNRNTVISTVVLILASILLSYLIPQRFITPPDLMEKWITTNPQLSAISESIGLNHIFTTPWFAVLLFFFLISIVVSSFEQMMSIVKKMHGHIKQFPDSGITAVTKQEPFRVLSKKGYIRINKNGQLYRYIKHPWGYWGNFLFHFGIALVIVSSLILVLTQKRAMLELIEGETHMPQESWTKEENGILVKNFILPVSVKVVKFLPEFWETDDLKQLATELNITDDKGMAQEYTVRVNKPVNYHGIIVFQSTDFGKAFYVELLDQFGKWQGIVLPILTPEKKDKPSYNNFYFSDIPYLLKVKYYPDVDKKLIFGDNPLLVLRLVDRGKVIGEASLKTGESGSLGSYKAKLAKVASWTGIIFMDLTGMPGIFTGFFIIILGGMLKYFTPPREIYITKSEENFVMAWKASWFRYFYEEEFDEILRLLSMKKGDL